MTKTTLVVMAAGMGSRFGGLKQIEPIGKNGEAIVDYSVYDAVRAGFDDVVFIIKKEIEEDFKRTVGSRIEKIVPVRYVYQTVPSHRKKPYGTGDAVLCCKAAVTNPFAVINADDYYGAEAYKKLHDYLVAEKDYAMVGFQLENTVTENGTVSRGICAVKDGFLSDVCEVTNIPKDNDFPQGTIASMNFWGLQPDVFDELEAQFNEFLKSADISKDEFFLPTVINNMIKSGKVRVKMLTTCDKWYGVTYKEDKDVVVKAIAKMTSEGKYE